MCIMYIIYIDCVPIFSYYRKMSLGQIDGLGQFVSRFDPDPDSVMSTKKTTTGSKFFKSKKAKEKVLRT